MSAVRTAPPAAPAALLYAVVKSPWAVWATASPASITPVIEAGDPNPVTAVPGHTPTFPLTVVAVPVTLVTVDPANIPKLHADPSPEFVCVGGAEQEAEVVNVHTILCARVLPYVSAVPVVIVAVNVVLGAMAAEGVKVAILVNGT